MIAEYLLTKLLTPKDIEFPHDTYMRRWLLRESSAKQGGARIHKICMSDDYRELHDHPFDFTSIVLRGGYIEHTEEGSTEVKPGDIIFRRAEDLHRIELHRDFTTGKEIPAWTFVITGPHTRAWGFQTVDGWQDAKTWSRFDA